VLPTVSRRACAAGALLLLLVCPAAAADAPVGFVVLKEHGVGNQTLAQPYLDRMLTLAAKLTGWPGAAGKYFTSRSAAETFIKTEHPHFGILSLPAFLAMREPYKLTVIGRVAVSLAGGRRYFIISKQAGSLAECKGQTLASDHIDDTRFVERVLLHGQATLADFKTMPTQRPLQTIRAVMNGQAVCALIDDAQKDQFDHLENKDGVRTVWESPELPPMPVVAFPDAPATERRTFKDNIDAVCEEEGKNACAEVGIDDLAAAADSDYASVVTAYGGK
jgi:hypothetical protein